MGHAAHGQHALTSRTPDTRPPPPLSPGRHRRPPPPGEQWTTNDGRIPPVKNGNESNLPVAPHGSSSPFAGLRAYEFMYAFQQWTHEKTSGNIMVAGE